jgi:hypothetical protein
MLRLLSVGLLSAVVFSSAFWPELAIADTGSELPEFEIS